MVVMPKLDGIACSIRYDADGKLALAATRGSGSEGEDITMNVLLHPWTAQADRPRPPGDSRRDLHATCRCSTKYADEFSNPRNTAAGGVRQKHGDGRRAADLTFGAYDIIGLSAANRARQDGHAAGAEDPDRGPRVHRARGDRGLLRVAVGTTR